MKANKKQFASLINVLDRISNLIGIVGCELNKIGWIMVPPHSDKHNCSTCRFGLMQRGTQPPARGVQVPYGICRADPPISVPTPDGDWARDTVHPTVSGNDWCGHYRERNRPDA